MFKPELLILILTIVIVAIIVYVLTANAFDIAVFK